MHVLFFVLFFCKYQCSWLPGKARHWKDLLCVEWDGKSYYCNCNWGTCIAPPTRRPRAHHRVDPYHGASRQNETEMTSDSMVQPQMDRYWFRNISNLDLVEPNRIRYTPAIDCCLDFLMLKMLHTCTFDHPMLADGDSKKFSFRSTIHTVHYSYRFCGAQFCCILLRYLC